LLEEAMTRKLLFPETREDLCMISLALPANGVYATAVLMAPRGGKYRQEMLLLRGSRFSASTTNTCPAHIERERRSLRDNGKLIRRGEQSILEADIRCSSLSEAAELCTGSSKSGWEAWQFNGKSLGCAFDDKDLVFYKEYPPMPPYVAPDGEAFSVLPKPGTRLQPQILARGSRCNVHHHQLAKDSEQLIEEEDEFYLECRAGSLSMSFSGLVLGPTEAILLQGDRRHFIVAVEDATFTTVHWHES
jgi:hypothetical protein